MGVRKPEEDDEPHDQGEPERPDERCERTRGPRGIRHEVRGNVPGEQEAESREARGRPQERWRVHELLDDLDVLLPGVQPIGRPHVVVRVHEERERAQERADHEECEDEAGVVDVQVAAPDGLSEDPPDV